MHVTEVGKRVFQIERSRHAERRMTSVDTVERVESVERRERGLSRGTSVLTNQSGVRCRSTVSGASEDGAWSAAAVLSRKQRPAPGCRRGSKRRCSRGQDRVASGVNSVKVSRGRARSRLTPGAVVVGARLSDRGFCISPLPGWYQKTRSAVVRGQNGATVRRIRPLIVVSDVVS